MRAAVAGVGRRVGPGSLTPAPGDGSGPPTRARRPRRARSRAPRPAGRPRPTSTSGCVARVRLVCAPIKASALALLRARDEARSSRPVGAELCQIVAPPAAPRDESPGIAPDGRATLEDARRTAGAGTRALVGQTRPARLHEQAERKRFMVMRQRRRADRRPRSGRVSSHRVAESVECPARGPE